MGSPETRYRQALQALEAGNKERARSLLAEVLEQDSFYVDAWVAMAQTLPDGDEKLDVLEQVLLLDPDNEYASEERARMLDLPSPREEAEAANKPPPKKVLPATQSDEVLPGIPRRWAILAGVGLVAYTLLICGVTFAVISSTNTNRAAAEREQATSIAEATRRAEQLRTGGTATAEQISRDRTATVEVATQQANQTATAQASITPSVTPSPTQTPIGDENRVAPPPRNDLPGTILAWGGFNPNPASQGFAEYRLYAANGGGFTVPNDDEVRSVTGDVRGERQVYVWLEPRFREVRIVDIATPGEASDRFDLTDWVTDQGGVTELDQPDVSADGQRLAFTALAPNGTREIFYYIYEGQTLIQVTRDNLNYLEVSFSADGEQIAAVRQSPGGTDLVLFDVRNIADPGTYPVTVLTNDGDAVIESNPAFSPIGAAVAYSALPQGATQADINSINVETGASTPLVAGDEDEIEPVYSPTGRYLAYAANPNGTYNIFIFDTLTSAIFQLSLEAADPVYPGGWIE